jgi:tRNA A37 threonylcarbamoyladenosine modification protein TsaB
MYILSVSTFSLNSSFSLLKKENNSVKTVVEFNLYYNDIDNQSQLNIFPYFFKLVKEKMGIDLKDIKEVLLLKGPGFFTSLRIGAIISQTLAFINHADLYSIDTFRAILNVLIYFYKDYVVNKSDILVVIKVANNKFKLAYFNRYYFDKLIGSNDLVFSVQEFARKDFYEKVREYSLNNNLILVSPNLELDDQWELENVGVNFIDLRDIFTSSNIARASFYLNNLTKEDPISVILNY